MRDPHPVWVVMRPFAMPVADARRLAAAATLDGAAYAALSQAGRDAAFALYEAGHYRQDDEEE